VRVRSLPASFRTSDCTVIVVRPALTSLVVHLAAPDVSGRKKFDFDSIVEVDAPSGRFR
jgi:hypothetical protein